MPLPQTSIKIWKIIYRDWAINLKQEKRRKYYRFTWKLVSLFKYTFSCIMLEAGGKSKLLTGSKNDYVRHLHHLIHHQWTWFWTEIWNFQVPKARSLFPVWRLRTVQWHLCWTTKKLKIKKYPQKISILNANKYILYIKMIILSWLNIILMPE